MEELRKYHSLCFIEGMGTGWILPSVFLLTDFFEAHLHISIVVVIYKISGVVTAKNPTKVSMSTKIHHTK
jgi:hypothetical protein